MRSVWMTALCAVSLSLSTAALASDDHGRDNRNNGGQNRGAMEASLVGSVPSTTVGGVPSGGVPWVVRGEASVSGSGHLHVEVSGLLIAAAPGVPANLVGTVGPVKMVGASLVCGGSGGSVAASSDGVPLSLTGDAEIDEAIALPPTCMAPVVLIRIFNASAPVGSQLGPFIALTGITAGQGSNNNNGDH